MSPEYFCQSPVRFSNAMTASVGWAPTESQYWARSEVTSISEGSMLAVFAERTCDMGMIGYEMTLLAARVGHMLTPGRRAAGPEPADRIRR